MTDPAMPGDTARAAPPLIVSIGHGAMAQALARGLGGSGLALGGVLLRPGSTATPEPGLQVFRDPGALIAARPAMVVECAGHAAVHETVPQLLAAGIDVAIVSVGALTRAETRAAIAHAAETGGARAIVVSGAVGGLDVLRAGARAGLDTVTYIGRKPPGAWRGSPAERIVDLDRLAAPAVFFEGTAAEAAEAYPKNANVAAAVALAGVGFEATRVRLIADPGATGNSHELEAAGAFGSFRITLDNKPLPDNPKTSWLAALSVEQAVVRHFSSMEV